MNPSRVWERLGFYDGMIGRSFLDNPFDSMSVRGRYWIDGLVRAIIAIRSEES